MSEPSRGIDEGQSHLLDLLVSDLWPLKCFAREIHGFLTVRSLANEGRTDGFDRDGQIQE